LSDNPHLNQILEDLHGPKSSFLQLYLDYATQVCDAPPVFHQFISYAIIATALGNKVWFQFGDQRIFPHLWLILLAPSSLYHKSSALGVGHRLLNRVSEDLVYPTEFSPEELLRIIQDQPSGAFFFYEFMSFATYLERDYMLGTKGLFTELYDSPPYRKRKIRKESFVVRYPSFSIFSATTTEWFLEKARERDLFGGWLPRYIFLADTQQLRQDDFPPPPDMSKQNALVKQLYHISELKGEAHFTADAHKLYKQLYRQFVAKAATSDPTLVAFYTRLQMYLLKLALILEVGNDPHRFAVSFAITSHSVQAAHQLTSFLSSKLQRLIEEEFVFTKFASARKKVLNLIQSASPEGISRRDLLRKSRLSVRFFDDVLVALSQEERFDVKTLKVEGSRKSSKLYVYKLSQP